MWMVLMLLSFELPLLTLKATLFETRHSMFHLLLQLALVTSVVLVTETQHVKNRTKLLGDQPIMV